MSDIYTFPTVELAPINENSTTAEQRAVIRSNLVSLQKFISSLREFYSWITRIAVRQEIIDQPAAVQIFKSLKNLSKDKNVLITSMISNLKSMNDETKSFVKSHYSLPCTYHIIFICMMNKCIPVSSILKIVEPDIHTYITSDLISAIRLRKVSDIPLPILSGEENEFVSTLKKRRSSSLGLNIMSDDWE